MRPYHYPYPVIMVQSDASVDPFHDVERHLGARGIACARILPDQLPAQLTPVTRVVMVHEFGSSSSREVLRQAIRRGVGIIVTLNDESDGDINHSLRTLTEIARESRGRVCVAVTSAVTNGAASGALLDLSVERTTLPVNEVERGRVLASVVASMCEHSHRTAIAPPAIASNCPPTDSSTERFISSSSSILDRTLLASQRAKPAKPVLVNCVVCEDSPVGGVRTWANRLAHGFRSLDLPYEVRTLLIATRPDAWDSYKDDLDLDDLTSTCVIDPSVDQLRSLSSLIESIRRVAGGVPAIIAPNYSDLTYAAAMHLRRSGSRVLSIAHTDDEYYKVLARSYADFDGAVGVSSSCMQWLAPIAASVLGDRNPPIAQIVYGVPVASSPRSVATLGPLQLAYVGRMVETQKRISDLLIVVDELERRRVPFVLHMVGDGSDLPAWKQAWDSRSCTFGDVVFHGRKDPAWVESFLSTIDISVLVSEFEGTSVTMLEAMGAGVVPAVTEVASGVGDWITSGVTGITAPVGRPELVAERIAALAADRGRIATMGRAAWEHVRGSISIEAMCLKYAELFARMPAPPVKQPPSDVSLRLHDRWRWPKTWCEDSDLARTELGRLLASAGFARAAWGVPAPGCDAVVIDSELETVTPALKRRMEAWRAEGFGVVVWPHLIVPSDEEDPNQRCAAGAERMLGAARAAARAGARRIAVYGVGKHTRRIAGVFASGLPFVGFIDDRPPAWGFLFGLPVVQTADALASLAPDAIILSSDACEPQLWEQSQPFRNAGVKVIRLYADSDRAIEVGLL